MYETYQEKLYPFCVEKNIHLHFMHTNSLVLTVNTNDIVEDLRNPNDLFDFSNLDQIFKLFNNKKSITRTF